MDETTQVFRFETSPNYQKNGLVSGVYVKQIGWISIDANDFQSQVKLASGFQSPGTPLRLGHLERHKLRPHRATR